MEMCFLLFLAWICKNLFPCCPVQRFCLSACGGPQIFKDFQRGTFFYSQEDSMGTGSSKPEPSNDKQCVNTAAPTTASMPGFLEHFNIQHLVLAFFAGVLLTLLLLALIFFVIKSYRKCHSSPWALDPPTDPHSSREPPAKLSSPEEALTYASVAFKISEEKSDH